MSFFSKIPNVLSFEAYDKYHIIVLLVILTIFILTVLFRKKLRNWKHEKTFRMVTVSIAIIFELSYKLWVIYVGQKVLENVFSLDLCAISLYMAWVLFFTKKKALFNILYFFSLGALASLLYPDFGTFGPDHMRFYHYFIVHTFIIWAVVYFIAVYDYRIKFKDCLHSFIILMTSGVIVLGIDLLLKTNYMFLREKPGVGTPLDYFGPWPTYLIGLALLVVILFLIVYIPWFFVNRYNKGNHIK